MKGKSSPVAAFRSFLQVHLGTGVNSLPLNTSVSVMHQTDFQTKNVNHFTYFVQGWLRMRLTSPSQWMPGATTAHHLTLTVDAWCYHNRDIASPSQ